MINKFIGVGRLTKEPELKSTPNGVSVLSFTVAIQRKYKDANGERQSDFINCVAFRGTADFISQYFNKGDLISIDGSIQTRSWEDSEGKKRYVTEVIVNEAGFIGSKKKDETSEDLPQMPEEFNVEDDGLPF